MIKSVHHVGIAVKNLDHTIGKYSQMLGEKPHDRHDVPAAGLKIASFKVGETILEFLEGAAGSVMAEFVAARGEGLHHLALEVDDIAAELKRLAVIGVEIIDKEPRQTPDGQIAFVGPGGAHGVTIELVQLIKG